MRITLRILLSGQMQESDCGCRPPAGITPTLSRSGADEVKVCLAMITGVWVLFAKQLQVSMILFYFFHCGSVK